MKRAGKETFPILMTGGGTLGPVTPLIAVVEAWKRREPGATFAWVGTPSGPESEIVKAKRIPFFSLRVPKLHRHNKLAWVLVPFGLVWSLVGAWRLLSRIKPKMVMTAGGYVSVPLVWVAWIRRIPVWVHQLDVVAGVANKVMAPFASRVSVTFESSLRDFGSQKTLIVGGVVRDKVMKGDAERARASFGLKKRPTLLVIGGGTGAMEINEIMEVIGGELLERMNVIHLTGIGKCTDALKGMGEGYVAMEFLNTRMMDAYAIADAVVARAGMGTLLEIIRLAKPALLIPMPNSHQEENARVFEKAQSAEVVYKANPLIVKQMIERIMFDGARRGELERRLCGMMEMEGAQEIVQHARRLLLHEDLEDEGSGG